MSSEIKSVVIVGASGTVGRTLIAALIEVNITVTALTRPGSTADPFPDAVTTVQCAYDDKPKLIEVFKDKDAVVSTVAPFGVQTQYTAIDAAVEAGIKRFIPSEFGLDTSLPNLAEVAPFAVEKKKVAEYLKTKEASGLSWTVLCTSAFFPWQLELGSGKMGWDVAHHRATIYDSGSQTYDASTVLQAARAIKSILLHPQETRNQYVYTKSFTLTQNRVLETLEKVSGQKFEISRGSVKDSVREGFELVEKGDLKNGYPKITTGAAYGSWGVSDFGGKTKKWMEVLELKDEEDRFEDIVKECLTRMTGKE